MHPVAPPARQVRRPDRVAASPGWRLTPHAPGRRLDSVTARPTHSWLRLLVATAAIVLTLGLPRFLIVCHHDGEALGHLEFAAAEGDCCEAHAHTVLPRREPRRGDGERATAAADCEHTGFDVELSPPGAPPAPALAAPTHEPPHWLLPAAHRAHVPQPPSTGPPRPDPGLCARATIRLQL